jgi:hypothetical protein
MLTRNQAKAAAVAYFCDRKRPHCLVCKGALLVQEDEAIGEAYDCLG